jgi:hypothetical protein
VRGVRVILGEPQPRGGDADLRVFAVLLADPGQGGADTTLTRAWAASRPNSRDGTRHPPPRTRTSGAAGNGVRSGNRPHGSDHRTTSAHMARGQLFSL